MGANFFTTTTKIINLWTQVWNVYTQSSGQKLFWMVQSDMINGGYLECPGYSRYKAGNVNNIPDMHIWNDANAYNDKNIVIRDDSCNGDASILKQKLQGKILAYESDSSSLLFNNVSDVRTNGWFATPTFGYNLRLASDFNIGGFSAYSGFQIQAAHEPMLGQAYPSSETMYTKAEGKVREVVLDSRSLIIDWLNIKQYDPGENMRLIFSGIPKGKSSGEEVIINLSKTISLMDDSEAFLIRDIADYFEQSNSPIILQAIEELK